MKKCFDLKKSPKLTFYHCFIWQNVLLSKARNDNQLKHVFGDKWNNISGSSTSSRYTDLQQLYSNVVLWNKIKKGRVFTNDGEFCTSERQCYKLVQSFRVYWFIQYKTSWVAWIARPPKQEYFHFASPQCINPLLK